MNIYWEGCPSRLSGPYCLLSIFRIAAKEAQIFFHTCLKNLPSLNICVQFAYFSQGLSTKTLNFVKNRSEERDSQKAKKMEKEEKEFRKKFKVSAN